MIEINLLPQEFRKKSLSFPGFSKIDLSKFDLKNVPVFHIAVVIGALMVIVQLALLFMGMASSAQFSSVSKNYNELLPMKKEADALKAQVAEINKRSAAIDELILKRFSWAAKLSALSDCVTPGIWLSELYYDERPAPGKGKVVLSGALAISGYASGAGEQGAALIGKFIKTLQDSKDFYTDFESIDLVSTKSDKADSQDVMSFRIICYFK